MISRGWVDVAGVIANGACNRSLRQEEVDTAVGNFIKTIDTTVNLPQSSFNNDDQSDEFAPKRFVLTRYCQMAILYAEGGKWGNEVTDFCNVPAASDAVKKDVIMCCCRTGNEVVATEAAKRLLIRGLDTDEFAVVTDTSF
jgi:hypothetical protein